MFRVVSNPRLIHDEPEYFVSCLWFSYIPAFLNVVDTPVLVSVRVQMEFSHAETRQEPNPRDAKHEQPDDLERLSKHLLHLVLQRLIELRDRRNRRKSKFDVLWELGEELGGQFLLQLVLQDRTAHGDPPYLHRGDETVSKEC